MDIKIWAILNSFLLLIFSNEIFSDKKIDYFHFSFKSTINTVVNGVAYYFLIEKSRKEKKKKTERRRRTLV